MKKVALIIQMFTILSLSLIAQEKVDSPYEFPIRPTSKEWGSISSSKEMLAVCQIPDSILKNISTKALAETCLNYPLFFEYTASNDERSAIEVMIQNFNGLKELSQRDDGMIELMKLYQELPIRKESTSKIQANDVPYKTMYLELVLADKNFVGKANYSELQELKKILLNKYEGKLSNSDIHSLYSIRKTLLLGAVVYLKQDSFKTTKSTNTGVIESFIKHHNSADSNELSIVSKIITE
jgi:hypothetical protein